ncbi:MAG: hypothetical protein Q4D38_04525 [Planctomycetia bacterium]|nr:hypothetical protein [Planctomycetia bacterium]
MPMYRSLLAATFVAVCLFAQLAEAYTIDTRNFRVDASDPRISQKVAQRAEKLRKSLALFWLGTELPDWSKKCTIKVHVGGNLPAAGETTFTFHNREVYDWEMKVQGTEERIYDSVLPHEVTHTILASYFRQPVPRWADEGAATFTEADAERDKYQRMLHKFLRNHRGIPLDRLFVMEEYPAEPLTLYAQGFSVSEFLIRQRGPQFFVRFVERCMHEQTPLDQIVWELYGYEGLRDLQNDWLEWVGNGSPNFCESRRIQVVEATFPPTDVIAGSSIPAPQSRNGWVKWRSVNHGLVEEIP